jgi:hypothetical protein
MAQLSPGSPQETPITRNPHQHLGNTKRHNLRIRELAPRVTRPLRQKVVSRAVHTDAEQVEVGDHRWLQSDADKTPPTSTCTSWSLATAKAVASII